MGEEKVSAAKTSCAIALGCTFDKLPSRTAHALLWLGRKNSPQSSFQNPWPPETRKLAGTEFRKHCASFFKKASFAVIEDLLVPKDTFSRLEKFPSDATNRQRVRSPSGHDEPVGTQKHDASSYQSIGNYVLPGTYPGVCWWQRIHYEEYDAILVASCRENRLLVPRKSIRAGIDPMCLFVVYLPSGSDRITWTEARRILDRRTDLHDLPLHLSVG